MHCSYISGNIHRYRAFDIDCILQDTALQTMYQSNGLQTVSVQSLEFWVVHRSQMLRWVDDCQIPLSMCYRQEQIIVQYIPCPFDAHLSISTMLTLAISFALANI